MCDGDFRMQRNWSLESPYDSHCIVERVASRHIPTFGRTRRFLDIKIETLPPKCKSKSVKQIPPVRPSPTMVEVKDVQVARSFGCPAKKKADPLVVPIPVWGDGPGRPMGCERQGGEQNAAAALV